MAALPGAGRGGARGASPGRAPFPEEEKLQRTQGARGAENIREHSPACALASVLRVAARPRRADGPPAEAGPPCASGCRATLRRRSTPSGPRSSRGSSHTHAQSPCEVTRFRRAAASRKVKQRAATGVGSDSAIGDLSTRGPRESGQLARVEQAAVASGAPIAESSWHHRVRKPHRAKGGSGSV